MPLASTDVEYRLSGGSGNSDPDASLGANATAAAIANESTAPASVTFSNPTSQGAGLSLGNLAPGQFYAVWIRRTVSSSASAYTNDGPLLRVSFDTAA